MVTARMPEIGIFWHCPSMRGVAVSLSGDEHWTSWYRVMEPCEGAYVWYAAAPNRVLEEAARCISGIILIEKTGPNDFGRRRMFR